MKLLAKLFTLLTILFLVATAQQSGAETFKKSWTSQQLELVGNVYVYPCTVCPDGKGLGDMGWGNKVRWQVDIPHDGTYEVRLFHHSREDRAADAIFSIDGLPNAVFKMPSTRLPNTEWDTVTLQLPLRAGTHELMVDNPRQMISDIAKVTVTSQLKSGWQFDGLLAPERRWFVKAKLGTADMLYMAFLAAAALLSVLLGFSALRTGQRLFPWPVQSGLSAQPYVMAALLVVAALTLSAYIWEAMDASYLGSVTAYILKINLLHLFGVLAIWFALLYTGHWDSRNRSLMRTLWVLLGVTTIIEVIDPFTEWMNRRASLFTGQSFLPLWHDSGRVPLLNYILPILSTLGIMYAAGHILAYQPGISKVYKLQGRLLLAAFLAPVIAAYVLNEVAPRYLQLVHHDQSMTGLAAVPMLIGIALHRFRLLELSPASWSWKQVDRSEPEWVISSTGHLVEANAAAQPVLGNIQAGERLQLPDTALLHHADQTFAVQRQPLGKELGERIALVNITERYASEQALIAANTHLADLQMELLAQSRRDPLTNLYNRRYLTEWLAEYDCSGKSLGVILLDVDHFREFNARYGYGGGDEVLKRLSGLLSSTEGTAFRYGGEEFLLLFPETDLQTTQLRAEELRQAVSSMTISYAGHPLQVTISCGVICADGLDIQELLSAADAALHLAKRRGRNRIEIGRRQPDTWGRGWG